MKHCPKCNRLESDDALVFCRTDGTPLVSDSANLSSESGTIKLGSGEVLTETQTKQLESTGAAQSTFTGPTGVLTPQDSRSKSNRRWFVVAGVLVILSIIAAASVAAYLARKANAPINSIAVMPFVNESRNPDIDYLSDGMTETLISSLSQVTDLQVKARSSVFRYKGKETNPRTIGQELNVQAILNGNFSKRGDQLILTLELVNAQTENVLWSAQYNRPEADLVNLQADIARDVANKLTSKLSGIAAEKVTKTYTTNPEAYRLYLQGRFYWNKREEKGFQTAVQYFDQAITLDQNYALAHAGRADAYALLGTFGFMSPTEAIPKARESARRASTLDPTLAEPRTTLAYLLVTYDYDFAGSEREFKRAIELNPNYATAHHWYGELLTNVGRFGDAEAEFRRALDLEPLSLPINWDLARFFYNSRRFDESVAQHKKTIELDPGFARAHRTLAEVYRVKGDYANAIEERAKFFELVGQSESAALIRATFAKSGWRGFLRLLTAADSPLRDSNNPWVLTKAYVDLGENDKAIAELNKAFELRLSSIVWLKVDPQIDPLRSDPRFQELLKTVGF